MEDIDQGGVENRPVLGDFHIALLWSSDIQALGEVDHMGLVADHTAASAMALAPAYLGGLENLEDLGGRGGREGLDVDRMEAAGFSAHRILPDASDATFQDHLQTWLDLSSLFLVVLQHLSLVVLSQSCIADPHISKP